MKRDFLWELGGWILFIICSFFYIASGIKAGDVLVLIGSLVFFIACVFFLIPFLQRR